jgi:hypothetical protein
MNEDSKTYLIVVLGRFLRALSILGTLALIVWLGCIPLTHWLLSYQHPLLEALRQHFIQHLPEYLTTLGVLFVAFVCTMPANLPQTLQDWWTWCRDGLQTAVPAARARQEQHSSATLKTPVGTSTQEATASTAVDPTQPK